MIVHRTNAGGIGMTASVSPTVTDGRVGPIRPATRAATAAAPGRRRLAFPVAALSAIALISASIVTATVGASPAAAAVTGGACNAFSGARSLGTPYTDSQVTIPTCGPRPFSGGSQTSVRPYPGALTTPGYQCVEFSERYLFYKYNVTMPIGTNGSQIVDHYVSRYPSLFTKIGNGTANAAPQQGDVLSFSNFSNFSSDNGHTAVVSSSAVDRSGNGRISIVEENASASGNNVLSVSNWVVQPLGYRYTKWLHRPVAPVVVPPPAPFTKPGDRAIALRHNGPGGYTVSPYGVLTAFGGAPALASNSIWTWNIARGMVLRSDDLGGYILDGWGGVHPFGNAPGIGDQSSHYWSGWDIARAIVLRSDNQGGYVLDGFGGLHAFGNAPGVGDQSSHYWAGWDIARAVALTSDNGGYVLDGFGGLHPFGNAPSPGDQSSHYWAGWDIARSVSVIHSGTGGYVLDGFGGLHAFGNASAIGNQSGHYWAGWDIARSVAMNNAGTVGYVVDGLGGLHVA